MGGALPRYARPMSSPVLAEVVRNGFVEGRHRGSVVWLDASGGVSRGLGDVDAPFLPRSSSKPLQALAMLRAGLQLPSDLLAVACSSHSGEPMHVEAVRRILGGAGLDESALQTPAGWPLEDYVRDAVARTGGGATPVTMNCSGKHAAMLATCVANGWDTASYLEPDHPLQRVIRGTVEELTGVPVEVATVDGCGAPLLSTTLTGLARAFRLLAVAADGPERTVADAVRAHPELVSGSSRDEAALLRAVPGAIAKAGAEAVYAVALRDGRAVALKVEDGSPRARPVVMAAALLLAGVADVDGVDLAAVRATGEHLLRGGQANVGEIRATLG